MEIINGRLSGPILLVDVAIHGDELNGVEIVRQLLTKVDPHKLRGTLVAVPVVNVFGFCPPLLLLERHVGYGLASTVFYARMLLWGSESRRIKL
ncbi:hypothetical protein [Photobacterium lutimaris]|uniref:hypothetical protein n=1 Tax=Photobacterium lutimaris TaxID=388278 RepID=UPI003B846794